MGQTSLFTGSTRFMLAAFAVATLVFASMLTVAPQQAKATPQFSQQTGKQCGFCHSKPPALNAQGKKFKAKGNKL